MSKLITITENDSGYRMGLAEMLIGDGAVPVVFEVADDFDLDSYEGLAPFNPTSQIAPGFSTKFPEVAAWLEAYSGTFEFYLSLKEQFARKGMLSEKQIACVQRAIASDRARGVQTPEAKAQNFSIVPGTVLILRRGAANGLAAQAGYARAHRAFEVVEVEAETAKAYRVKVKFSARKTSHCGICGLVLENPESIAAGIGPICAANLGIPYGEGALASLGEALPTVELMAWVAKSVIKERSDKAEVPQLEDTGSNDDGDRQVEKDRLNLQFVSDPQWVDRE